MACLLLELTMSIITFFIGHNFVRVNKSKLKQKRNFPQMVVHRKNARLRMQGKFSWEQAMPYELQDLTWPPQTYSKGNGARWQNGELQEPPSQNHGSPELEYGVSDPVSRYSLSIHLAHRTHWVISRPMKNSHLLVIFASYQLLNTKPNSAHNQEQKNIY